MQMKVRLVHDSEFFRGFWLNERHKPEKKHIFSDPLSRNASTNSKLPIRPEYVKLDLLFAYSATLVELRPTILDKIVRSCRRDTWWKKIHSQVEGNESLGVNKTVSPFEYREADATASDQYFKPRPESSKGIKIAWHPETSNPVEVEMDMIKEHAD